MIDYQKIADAIKFYQGYQYIDVPWVVSLDTMYITCPPECTIFPFLDKYLVASAEQSFLQLIKDKKLKNGKYLAATPCFRDDLVDAIHHKYFMKVELINIGGGHKQLDEILQDSVKFFQQYLPVQIVETSTKPNSLSFDINSFTGIELGSYGLREHPDTGPWVYGTGVAEPRLTYAIEQHYNSFRDIK